MKRFFCFIGGVYYKYFSRLNEVACKIHRALITGYYTRGMKSVGSGVSIDYPVDHIIGRQYISIGNYTMVNRRATITAWTKIGIPEIIIGSYAAIGEDCHITAVNRIEIGDGVQFGKRVTITDNSHGSFNEGDLKLRPIIRKVVSKGAVIIGKNVWLGDKVTVCPGVTVGEGTIVGANSVVTHDLPAFSVAVGTPARVIKHLEIQDVNNGQNVAGGGRIGYLIARLGFAA